jgi:hypothetical protein
MEENLIEMCKLYDYTYEQGKIVTLIITVLLINTPDQPCTIYIGTFTAGVKGPECEADHSPPSAEVKNSRSYTSTSPIRLHSVLFN